MPSRPSNPHDQFAPGQASEVAVVRTGETVDAAKAADPSPTRNRVFPGEEAYLVQLSRPAMACRFEITLNAGQHDEGSEAALAALDLIEELESQLTVYRDTSEVARINQSATESPVQIEQRLFELLQTAQRLSAETGGAFDVTSGPLTKIWGFYRRNGAIPAACELSTAMQSVGSDQLEFDAAERTVHFLRRGMELNLGAIGKGYALDRAAETMAAAAVENFLIHGGQSSVLARGSRGLSANGGWSVGIGHPLNPERRLAEVWLRDRALATSGASHQFFRHQGKRYGHILDPRTGWPAEGVLSSTVLAPTAAEADALSTAFYALGVTEAQAWLRGRPEIGALLVHPSPDRSSIEITVCGLTENDWRLTSI
ncbi:MAG TPA: FAD:protein FMN transferase [Pirellulales bacterium]|jgi:thiamine biosynthesis lipoprotein